MSKRFKKLRPNYFDCNAFIINCVPQFLTRFEISLLSATCSQLAKKLYSILKTLNHKIITLELDQFFRENNEFEDYANLLKEDYSELKLSKMEYETTHCNFLNLIETGRSSCNRNVLAKYKHWSLVAHYINKKCEFNDHEFVWICNAAILAEGLPFGLGHFIRIFETCLFVVSRPGKYDRLMLLFNMVLHMLLNMISNGNYLCDTLMKSEDPVIVGIQNQLQTFALKICKEVF